MAGTPTPARAPAGGAIGINSERYRGGAFMPTTRLPKRAAAFIRAKTRCALIAPGEVADVPHGQGAIFPVIREFVVIEDGQAAAMFTDAHPAVRYHFSEPADLHALIAAYNAGERFYTIGEQQ